MVRTMTSVLFVSAIALGANGVVADEALDSEMKTLAAHSGCGACHSIQSGQPDTIPIGPAWSDVAARYAHEPGAEDNLVQAVLKGSNPYYSHWRGKVSGYAMPPNAVAISEGDARRLVQWILALKK